MQKRVSLAEKLQVCISGMFSMTTGLSASDYFEPCRLSEARSELHELREAGAPAQGDKAQGPIMVVQGLNDTSVQASTTRRVWKRACEDGNEIHLRMYQGQEHSPVTEAAAPEWLGWIDDRFAGRTLDGGSCSEKSYSLMDEEYTKIGVEP